MEHEIHPCTANPAKQGHRGIKHQYYLTLGFGELGSDPTLCEAVCFSTPSGANKGSRAAYNARIATFDSSFKRGSPANELPWEPPQRFGSPGNARVEAAKRFCQAVDEVSNFLRPRNQMAKFACLSDRRNRFPDGIQELEVLFYAAIN